MKRIAASEFEAAFSRVILGASESVEIGISPFHPDWIRYVRQAAALSGRRLVRRMLLPGFSIDGPEFGSGNTTRQRGVFVQELRPFLENRWDVKTAPYSRLGFAILVDRQFALHAFPNPDRESRKRTSKAPSFTEYEGERELSEFTYQFADGWKRGVSFVPIYEESHKEDVDQPKLIRLITTSDEQFRSLIQYFAKHPHKMREMDPHKFEEFIAGLFEKEGFQVELAKLSRDGGRDILVSSESELGKTLHLVECKRHAVTNPINVALLRGLYGVVEEARATSGILVTTTRFTPPALEFVSRVPHRLAKKDYDDVVRWVRKHA
jgi:hypothetical protein